VDITGLKRGEEMGRQRQPASSAEAEAAWIPPPAGVTKINVDAAVGKNSRRGTVAAVARSDSGVFLGASAVVFHGQTTAEMLEVLACREAIALARDLDVRQIKVASD
jgi:hypothetical protein